MAYYLDNVHLYFILFHVSLAFLREVCNLVIQQCTASIDPPSIFQGEADEQLLKLRKGIENMKHFM